MKKGNGLQLGLWVASIILIMASLFMVFIYVPTERTMGIVQRIFYLMVPMGWLAMLSFLIIFVSSILYLKNRQGRWDTTARSAAELGLVFTTLTLITGSNWAKPIWGVWWTWEPRLTATLVLWLIYIAYFMVRSFASEESRGATFAAVIGIVGFVDLPIIALATTLWRGMHPGALVFEGGLAPQMVLTLLTSIVAYTVFYCLLLSHLVGIKNDASEINELKNQQGLSV
ncbi:MAG: cytochrome c biogenesis protein CcsA [Chloroflexota bacterium]